jgi:hypothetical protein
MVAINKDINTTFEFWDSFTKGDKLVCYLAVQIMVIDYNWCDEDKHDFKGTRSSEAHTVPKSWRYVSKELSKPAADISDFSVTVFHSTCSQ